MANFRAACLILLCMAVSAVHASVRSLQGFTYYGVTATVSGLCDSSSSVNVCITGQTPCMTVYGTKAQGVTVIFPFTLQYGTTWTATTNSASGGLTCKVNAPATGTVWGAVSVSVACTGCVSSIMSQPGVTVKGLDAGTQIVVAISGLAPLTITAAPGLYTTVYYAQSLLVGTKYTATLPGGSPTNYACTVNPAAGTVPLANNFMVTVECVGSTAFPVVSVKGLWAGSVTLGMTNNVDITMNGLGDKTLETVFPVKLPQSSIWTATVKNVPAGYSCDYTSNTGMVPVATSFTATLNCQRTATALFNLTISGLPAGAFANFALTGNPIALITGVGNASVPIRYQFPVALVQRSAFSLRWLNGSGTYFCALSSQGGYVPEVAIWNPTATCGAGPHATGWTRSDDYQVVFLDGARVPNGVRTDRNFFYFTYFVNENSVLAVNSTMTNASIGGLQVIGGFQSGINYRLNPSNAYTYLFTARNNFWRCSQFPNQSSVPANWNRPDFDDTIWGTPQLSQPNNGLHPVFGNNAPAYYTWGPVQTVGSSYLCRLRFGFSVTVNLTSAVPLSGSVGLAVQTTTDGVVRTLSTLSMSSTGSQRFPNLVARQTAATIVVTQHPSSAIFCWTSMTVTMNDNGDLLTVINCDANPRMVVSISGLPAGQTIVVGLTGNTDATITAAPAPASSTNYSFNNPVQVGASWSVKVGNAGAYFCWAPLSSGVSTVDNPTINIICGLPPCVYGLVTAGNSLTVRFPDGPIAATTSWDKDAPVFRCFTESSLPVLTVSTNALNSKTNGFLSALLFKPTLVHPGVPLMTNPDTLNLWTCQQFDLQAALPTGWATAAFDDSTWVTPVLSTAPPVRPSRAPATYVWGVNGVTSTFRGANTFFRLRFGSTVRVSISGLNNNVTKALTLSMSRSSTTAVKTFSYTANANGVLDTVMFGNSYQVNVTQQPNGFTCVITSGASGYLDVASVLVQVSCLNTPASSSQTIVVAAITGLYSGANLTMSLTNNPNATVSGTADGQVSWTFSGNLNRGSQYAFILTSPTNYICLANPSSGATPQAPILTISVSCVPPVVQPTFTANGLRTDTVSVSVTSSSGFNGIVSVASCQDTTSTQEGNGFSYCPSSSLSSSLPVGSTWRATMSGSSPNGYSCTLPIINGTVPSGSLNIVIACVPTSLSFPVIATSGLFTDNTYTVSFTGNAAINITGTGSGLNATTLPIGLPNGEAWSFSYTTNSSVVCSASPSSGVVPSSNSFQISVTCTSTVSNLPQIDVTGLYTGVSLPVIVTGNPLVSLTGTGTGTVSQLLPVGLPPGSLYTVTLPSGSPSGYSCSFMAGSAVPPGTVFRITITCVSPRAQVIVNATGLITGLTATVSMTGNNNIQIAGVASGMTTGTFPNTLPYGSAFTASLPIGSPANYNCSLNPSTGLVSATPVFVVTLSCARAQSVPILVVKGLFQGASLLANVNSLGSISADGVPSGDVISVFPYAINYGASYTATFTAPVGYACAFVGGSGAGVIPARITFNVSVTCTSSRLAIPTVRFTGFYVGRVNFTLTNNTLSSVNGASSGSVIANMPRGIPQGSLFSLTFSSLPNNYTCFVNTDTLVPATSTFFIDVLCGGPVYTPQIVVTGLFTGASIRVIVTSNPASNIQGTTSGNFTVGLSTSVPMGSLYTVLVDSVTAGYSCSASGGTVPSYIVSATFPVAVTCTTTNRPQVLVNYVNLFTPACISVAVTGAGTVNVCGNNNGQGTQTMTTALYPSFPYTATLPSGSPTDYSCSFSSASGAAPNAASFTLTLSCIPPTSKPAIIVNGLRDGATLQVQVTSGTTIISGSISGNAVGNVTSILSQGVFYGSSWTASMPIGNPAGYNCSAPKPASGTVAPASLFTVTFDCSILLRVNVTVAVTGLLSKDSLDVQVTNNPVVTINGTGTSNPATANLPNLLWGGTFSLTFPNGVPSWYVCGAVPAAGTTVFSNLTINVFCSLSTSRFIAAVSGLVDPTDFVTISLTGNTALTLTGSITVGSFSNRLPYGSAWQANVTSQPIYSCSLIATSGTVNPTDQNSLIVNCVNIATIPVTATIVGLINSNITFTFNGQTYVVSTDMTGSVTRNIPNRVVPGSMFSAVVPVSPDNYQCSPSVSSGIVPSSGSLGLTINCVAGVMVSVMVSVTGLPADVSVTVGMTKNDDATISGSASLSSFFTFPQQLALGSPWVFTAVVIPQGYQCSVVNSAGLVPNVPVFIIGFACSGNMPQDVRVYSNTLYTGATLVLSATNNPSVNILGTETGNIEFVLPNQIIGGTNYNSSIVQVPSGYSNCILSPMNGTVPVNAPLILTITCTPPSAIVLISITGLYNQASLQVDVTSNGASVSGISNIAGSPDGNVQFGLLTPLRYGAPWQASMPQGSPQGYFCSIPAAAGYVPPINTLVISISCNYLSGSIGALTITGLYTDAVLNVGFTNNQPQNFVGSPSGSLAYNFPIRLAPGSKWAVTFPKDQPAGYTCTATESTGTVPVSNSFPIFITCSPPSAVPTVTVTGLQTGAQMEVSMTNNANAIITVAAGGVGSNRFPVNLVYGSTFNVQIVKQPAGFVCSISSTGGAVPANPNLDIVISCQASTSPSSVSVTVVGLCGNQSILAVTVNGDTQSVSGPQQAPDSNGIRMGFSPAIGGSSVTISLGPSPLGHSCYVVNNNDFDRPSYYTVIAQNAGEINFVVVCSLGCLFGMVRGDDFTTVRMANQVILSAQSWYTQLPVAVPVNPSNALAIHVQNQDNPDGFPNPSGLTAYLTLKPYFTDNAASWVSTDSNMWRCYQGSTEPPADWASDKFDDSAWVTPTRIYGSGNHPYAQPFPGTQWIWGPKIGDRWRGGAEENYESANFFCRVNLGYQVSIEVTGMDYTSVVMWVDLLSAGSKVSYVEVGGPGVYAFPMKTFLQYGYSLNITRQPCGAVCTVVDAPVYTGQDVTATINCVPFNPTADPTCTLSDWSSWGACYSDGTQTRTRTVVSGACTTSPKLVESRTCVNTWAIGTSVRFAPFRFPSYMGYRLLDNGRYAVINSTSAVATVATLDIIGALNGDPLAASFRVREISALLGRPAYLRHIGNRLIIDTNATVVGDQTDYLNSASWYIRRDAFFTNSYLFESTDWQGYYIRATFSEYVLTPRDTSVLFMSEASFVVNPLVGITSPCETAEVSGWSQCDKSCGFQTQYRTRSIRSVARQNGDMCPPLVEIRTCGLPSCSSDGNITVETSPYQWYTSLADYGLDVRGWQGMLLSVRSFGAASIILSRTYADTILNAYEVILGYSDNNGVVVRRGRAGTDLSSVVVPTISGHQMRTFWIVWRNSTIRVGAGNVYGRNQLVSANTGAPVEVNHIAIMTGITPGIWSINPINTYVGAAAAANFEDEFAQQNDNGSKSSNDGFIIGVAVGSSVAAIILSTIFIFIYRRQSSKKQRKEMVVMPDSGSMSPMSPATSSTPDTPFREREALKNSFSPVRRFAFVETAEYPRPSTASASMPGIVEVSP